MKKTKIRIKFQKNKMERTAEIYPRNTDREGFFQSGLPEILKHFLWLVAFFASCRFSIAWRKVQAEA